MENNITNEQYAAFQAAYDFFNGRLFSASLPPVLVTLQRKAKSRGYFSPERFSGRNGDGTAHELALNPDHFGRTDAEILSTLVHEMAHVWQQEHGKPSRANYHNAQWGAKMIEVGLQPSNTGEPGGKTTGQQMTHYILTDGAFARAAAELAATGFRLDWQSAVNERQTKKKAANKTKYSCPTCGLNAWGKPGASLICGECYDDGAGEVQFLEEAD